MSGLHLRQKNTISLSSQLSYSLISKHRVESNHNQYSVILIILLSAFNNAPSPSYYSQVSRTLSTYEIWYKYKQTNKEETICYRILNYSTKVKLEIIYTLHNYFPTYTQVPLLNPPSTPTSFLCYTSSTVKPMTSAPFQRISLVLRRRVTRLYCVSSFQKSLKSKCEIQSWGQRVFG